MRELAQHITDLVENSVAAGARRIVVSLDRRSGADWLILRVSDDGRGMSREVLARATDAFYTSRTCRRVGLGLPLLAASSERSGGRLRIESEPGAGTTVEASFRPSNIDTPPVGDLKSTIVCAIIGHPEVEVAFRLFADGRSVELDGGAIKRELGEIPLTHPSVLGWLDEVITQGLAEIGMGSAETEETNA